MGRYNIHSMRKPKSYNETFGRSIRRYTCIDHEGKTVEVMPKNPDKHESSHTLDQHPTIHYNTDIILQYPDETIMNPKSNNPKSVANRKKGITKLYVKRNFVEMLNIPGHQDDRDVTSVYVLFGKDGHNRTLTRFINPISNTKRFGQLK